MPLKMVMFYCRSNNKRQHAASEETGLLDSNKGSFTAGDMVKRDVLDKIVITDLNLC
jgi:hypothetical protein